MNENRTHAAALGQEPPALSLGGKISFFLKGRRPVWRVKGCEDPKDPRPHPALAQEATSHVHRPHPARQTGRASV